MNDNEITIKARDFSGIPTEVTFTDADGTTRTEQVWLGLDDIVRLAAAAARRRRERK